MLQLLFTNPAFTALALLFIICLAVPAFYLIASLIDDAKASPLAGPPARRTARYINGRKAYSRKR